MVARRIKAHHAVSYTAYSHLQDHIKAIPALPFALRKDLLVIARCQLDPETSSRLRTQISFGKDKTNRYDPIQYVSLVSSETSNNLSRLDRSRRIVKPGTIVQEIATRCEGNPVFSGFISMLTRTLPINDPLFDPQEERLASALKEFHQSQKGSRPQVLDYNVWFSANPLDINLPLSPHLPPCPDINLRIRSCLHTFRNTISRMGIILPQINGKRSVSRSTATNFLESFEPPQPWSKEVLPRDLERRYADTGRIVGGYSELRQTWTFGDLKPRTYFAFGGQAYRASRFIRPVANELVNAFAETGFRSRFSYNDVSLSPSRRLFTYDYKSFTTNLAEQKYFLYALAEYMRDVEVEVLDTRYGAERVSVGEMIEEYTRVTTDMPEFTLQQLFEEEDFQPYIHLVGGFLGVYGNISTATSLHGMHASQICGSSTVSKCVGDDVLASGERESNNVQTFEETIDAVQSLGDVEQSKVQIWEDDGMDRPMLEDTGWHYTKRPIDRIGNNIAIGLLLEFPMYGALSPIDDGVHDGSSDIQTRLKSAAIQVFNLVRKARESLLEDLQEEDIEFILQAIRPVYAYFGVPSHGLLPVERLHGFKGNLFLPIDRQVFFEPLASLSIGTFDPGSPVSIPVTAGNDHNVDLALLHVGMEYDAVVDKFHRFMNAMGYIEMQPRFETAIMTYAEYILTVENVLQGVRFPVYSVRVVELPDWASDLQSRLLPPYDDTP